MRQQETKSFKVAGAEGPEDIDILVTALDGNTAGEMGVRLLQMFGPGIVGVITAMESNDTAKVTAEAGALFAKLSPVEFASLRKQLLKGSQAQHLGEFIDVDDTFIRDRFAGHVGSLFALVVFALKVNFANFFEDLGISKATMSKLTSKVEAAKKATIA